MLESVQIPPPGLSLGADIYRSYRTGAISWDEYLTANAAMVADLCHEERHRLYAPMPGIAKQYAESRIAGGRPYDKVASNVLGQWRYDVFKALDDNLYVTQHFEWALEKCKAVNLETQVHKLRAAIERFESMRFPYGPYGLACDVLKMDSDDKRKGGT